MESEKPFGGRQLRGAEKTMATLRGYYRFSGWLLLLSGLITIVIQYIHLEDVPADLNQMGYFVDAAVWTHIGLLLSFAMFLMGFVGLYLRQAAQLKWWGWLSFGCLFLFVVLDLLHAPIQIFSYPVLFAGVETEEQLQIASELVMRIGAEGPGTFLMMLLMPLVLVGTILMGIAMLKAGVLPKGPAIATLVSVVLIVLPYGPVTKYVFPLQYAVYVWYGAVLAFERTRVQEANVPTTGAGGQSGETTSVQN
ncbi:hypothetical protein [Paenibacillus ginsengarvi]|uniref:DUF4386 family protein n=1 Tax=Paenibacillus ginsengarvi TaxID=400777 RepID=A0A3B0BE64_9BACL|nr:hypothetical protein [Paenibacillus ginsengarvi]RKN70598.1 hypothetical protein D7M11_30485 [Paenibacillus ginsengarvi]